MTLASIGRYDRLPTQCITCGATTDRKERVRYREDDASGTAARLLVMLISLLGGLLVFFRSDREHVRLDVDVRRCARCARVPIKPAKIDFERMRMIFTVHRQFAEALAELRKSEGEAGTLSAPESDGGALSEPISRSDGDT